MNDKVRKLDAGESAFLENQLEHMLSQMFEVQYAELKARSLLPVNTEADPGAEFITAETWDMHGAAKILASYADDIPRVDVDATKTAYPVITIGAGYGLSIDEIESALLAGKNLSGKKAMAAREADERKLDYIAAFGDAGTGVGGFLNNSNVPSQTAANPGSGTTWEVKTPAEILADLQEIVGDMIADTNEKEVPDTIVLPATSYALIAQTQMTGINETVLSFFLKTSPYIRNVVQWHRLETAGAGSTKRMVAYRRDPSKLELHIPLEYQQLSPQPRNFEMVVPTRLKTAGCTIYKPYSVRYVDAI